jgi:hypothetical protein
VTSSSIGVVLMVLCVADDEDAAGDVGDDDGQIVNLHDAFDTIASRSR